MPNIHIKKLDKLISDIVSKNKMPEKILVVSKCDVLTTYLSCLDCILIKIDARQLHDFLSSWKSLKFSV